MLRVHVPKHTPVKVECRVLTAPLQDETTLIFEPSVDPQWPEGLEFTDTLVTLKGAKPVGSATNSSSLAIDNL